MKKMTKHIMSFILVLALCMSTIQSGAVTVFADDEAAAPETPAANEQILVEELVEAGEQEEIIDGVVISEDDVLADEIEADIQAEADLAGELALDDTADDKDLFVMNAISGATQKDVMVNGEQRVVYCMQYDKLWPTPEGGGYHNAPTKYWEASAEEMLLSEDQLAIVQRLLYAGYPYDSVGALEPLYTQLPMDADYYASELTQNVLWSFMAQWGVTGNTHYGDEPFDLSDLPGGQESYEALVDFAFNGGSMSAIPDDFTPEIIGNLSFHEDNDSYGTGELSITNPEGFKIMYYISIPDDVIPYDEWGDEIWPHYGMVNGEFTVIGYPIYGGETFYLYTNQPDTVAGQEIAITGSVKVPTDVKQYMTNDTGRGDKGDGQGFVQHPYQTMLSVGIASKDFAGSATFAESEIEVTVTKVWEDDEDQDGLRPRFIYVSLYANGEYTGEDLVIDEAKGWTDTFPGLAKYDADGEEIEYTVVEKEVSGYEATYSDLTADGIVITNTHEPSTIDIHVTKEWDDDGDAANKRPDEITVVLLANNDFTGKTATLNAENRWGAYFNGLPEYENGEIIVYTIEEIGVREYETAIEGNQDTGFSITNTYTPGKVEIPVTKIWEDSHDQDGKRPEKITVVLFANGQPTDTTLELSADNNWEGAFTDLDEYDSEFNLINYSVEEANVGVDGYESDIIQVGDDPVNGFIITNSYTPETTSIPVKKVWEDNGDADGKRPDEIVVVLLANNDFTGESVTLSESNDWEDEFTDLPVYENGVEIIYTIEEVGVREYETVIEGNQTVGFTLTNTYTPGLVEVPVTKIWEDNNNQDGKRPDKIMVVLWANGQPTDTTLELSADNNWEGAFTELIEYDDNFELINYSVEEVAVDDYMSEVTQIGDDPVNGFTITNYYTPGKVEVAVTKVWVDNDDQDGMRADEITVVLWANGAETEHKLILSERNNWSGKFIDLDEYEAGVKIYYEVFEHVVAGYSEEYSIIGNDNYEGGAVDWNITNTHEPLKVSIPVEKIWDDNNDQDGVRPEKISVSLYADGEEIIAAELNEQNGWFKEFTDLDEYKDGHRIVYTVQEKEFYDGDLEPYTGTVQGSAHTGFRFTNTHEPGKIDINVEKIWDDDDDNDGIRPESITLILVADGQDTDYKIELSEENEWKGAFENLDEYKNGEKIKYTIKEVTVTGYETLIDESGYIITNKHVSSKINIPVKKVWDDKDDKDKIRPKEITVVLYADGEKTDQTLKLNKDNKWTGEFTDLPEFKAGVRVVYAVKEDKVEGYTAKVSGAAKDGFTITNSHTPKEDPTPTPGPNGPHTGDRFNPVLWGSILGIAAVGMFLSVFTFRKRKNR